MKKLNLYLCLFTLIASSLVWQSCDDNDGYSLGNFVVRMATVRVISGTSYYLEIDNGRTLFPAATQIPWYKPVDGQRVVADYTLLYDNYDVYDHGVRVNYLRNVLTKQIENLTEDNEDEFGNDKVDIYDMWIGGNYLNIQFRFLLPLNKAHRVSLVRNTTEEYPNDGYLYLEYRYNTFNDVNSNDRWASGLVSFNLGEDGPAVAASDYKGIKVKINSTTNGEKTYTYEFPERESASNNKNVENLDYIDDGNLE